MRFVIAAQILSMHWALSSWSFPIKLHSELQQKAQEIRKDRGLPKQDELTFELKTESHRMRVLALFVFLLTHESFLDSFPEFKVLTGKNLRNTLSVVSYHDFEKSPSLVMKSLATLDQIDFDFLPEDLKGLAKGLRADFNNKGDIITRSAMIRHNLLDSEGDLTAQAHLYLLLEGFIDRLDSWFYRKLEFNRSTDTVSEYVRNILMNSGTEPNGYSFHELESFSNKLESRPELIHFLLESVKALSPENYLAWRTLPEYRQIKFRNIQLNFIEYLFKVGSERANSKEALNYIGLQFQKNESMTCSNVFL